MAEDTSITWDINNATLMLVNMTKAMVTMDIFWQMPAFEDNQWCHDDDNGDTNNYNKGNGDGGNYLVDTNNWRQLLMWILPGRYQYLKAVVNVDITW